MRQVRLILQKLCAASWLNVMAQMGFMVAGYLCAQHWTLIYSKKQKERFVKGLNPLISVKDGAARLRVMMRRGI